MSLPPSLLLFILVTMNVPIKSADEEINHPVSVGIVVVDGDHSKSFGAKHRFTSSGVLREWTDNIGGFSVRDLLEQPDSIINPTIKDNLFISYPMHLLYLTRG
ncbi:TPA: hypothetical protein ACS29V_003934 [Klebsiella oxytoca]|nr:hypothetical protein JJ665_27555 [Klebsiella pneumoniae]